MITEEYIIELEKKVFTNQEHYNESGRKTRMKILNLAKGVEKGFFVEVGACMGTDTKILEYHGWNGLLVEPSESLFSFCSKTRSCIVENYALVSKDYPKESISDISVFKLPDYIGGHPENSGNYKTITLNELVKKHNIKKIDIFVLDVEGFELEILNGIDFDTIEISDFIIETIPSNMKEIDNFMLSKGYKNEGLVEVLDSINNINDYHYKKYEF